jgi:hypothetical protein
VELKHKHGSSVHEDEHLGSDAHHSICARKGPKLVNVQPVFPMVHLVLISKEVKGRGGRRIGKI